MRYVETCLHLVFGNMAGAGAERSKRLTSEQFMAPGAGEAKPAL